MLKTILFLGCLAVRLSAADESRLRVALLDFVSDAHSYRSWSTAKDFPTLLQATLPEMPGIEWVERREMSLVAAERDILWLSSPEVSQRARLASADWAVLGGFNSGADQRRTLTLKLIDLARAELLGQFQLAFTNAAPGELKLPADLANRAAGRLAPLLETARKTALAGSNEVRFILRGFPVFPPVQAMPPDMANRFRRDPGTDPWEAIRQGMSEALPTQGPFRSVNLQAGAASIDEAELSLMGMAESARGDSSSPADFFVTLRRLQPFSLTNREPGPMEFRIAHVSGTATVITGAPPFQAVVEWMADRVRSGDVRNPEAALGVRRALAAEMFQAVSGQVRNFEGYTREQSGDVWARAFSGRLDASRWRALVSQLDTICFFDPALAAAHESFVRVRWSRGLVDDAVSPFLFRHRRSDAWGRHLERFGATDHLGPAPTRVFGEKSVLGEALESGIDALGYYSKESENAPTDADSTVIGAFRAHQARALIRRLVYATNTDGSVKERRLVGRALQAIGSETYLPEKERLAVYLEWLPRLASEPGEYAWYPFDEAYGWMLRGLFKSAGKSGEAEDWIRKIQEGGAAELARRPPPPKAKPQPLPLPRTTALDPVLLLDSAPVSSGITRVATPPIRSVRFPQDTAWDELIDFLVTENDLWLVTRGRVAAPETSGPAEERSAFLQGETETRNLLWRASKETLLATNWTLGLEARDPLRLTEREGKIWMGLAADFSPRRLAARQREGAGRDRISDPRTKGMILDPASQDVFPVTNVNAGEVCGFAANGNRFFAIGNSLHELDTATGNWRPLTRGANLVGWQPWNRAVVSSGETAIAFFGDGPISLIGTGSLTAIAYAPGRTELPPVGDGRGGFWMAHGSDLDWFEPATGSMKRDALRPALTVGNAERGLQIAGDAPRSRYLHGGGFRERMAQRRKPAPAYGRRNAPVTALAMDGDFLWVATGLRHEPQWTRPAEISVLHTPSRRWVASVAIAGLIERIVIRGDAVWFAGPVTGGAGRPVSLWAWPKSALTDLPESQWVPMEADEEQVSYASPKERAIQALWRGQGQPIVDHFRDFLPEELGPTDLLLLALAHDEHALGKPEEQRRYEDELLRVFPDSAAACAIEWERQEAPLRKLVETRPLAPGGSPEEALSLIFERFDRDRDGELAAQELDLMNDLEPGWLRSRPAPFSDGRNLHSPGETLIMFHRKHPGTGLNAQELKPLLKAAQRPPTTPRP